MNIGKALRVDDRCKLLEAIVEVPTATLYELAGKCGDMAPGIRAIASHMRFAGFASTLRTLPGDNLGVFHAIDQAQPGDVLVIDAGGTDRVTIWGGTSTVAAQAKGMVACVTNGSVRDIDEIVTLKFPVFAAGVSVRGAAKNHPGWTGIAVSVGDVVVNPGDLVVGDSDGVVVIEAARVSEVVARVEEYQNEQRQREQRLRNGESIRCVLSL